MATKKTLRTQRGSSFSRFVAELDGRRAKASRVDPVHTFEQQLGHALHKDMAQLLPKLASLASAKRVGEAFFFPGKDWPSFSGKPERWAPSLFKKELFTLIGLFTDSLCLASDGGGDLYFVALGKKHSEVHVYAHATMELGFLADSIASFAQLQQLAQRANDAARAQKRDLTELSADDFERPPLAAARKELRALRGVRVPIKEFGCDISATLEPLAGRPLKAKSQGTMPRLYERAEWLITLLFADDLHDLERAQKRNLKKDLADAELGKLVATKLYWLWHLYVFARDEELQDFAEKLARDKSELVRSTASLLTRLATSKKLPATLLPLRRPRQLVQQALSGAAARQQARQQEKFVEAQRAHRDWVEAFFSAEDKDPEVFTGLIAWLRAHLQGQRVWPPSDADATRLIALAGQRPDLSRSNLEALFDLAGEWKDDGRAELALDLYQHLLQIPLPRSGDLRDLWLRTVNNAVIAAFELGKPETSRLLFERAERAAPENPYIYHSVACAYVALNELERAAACIRLAVKYDYEHLDLLKIDDDLEPVLARPDMKTLLEIA